MIRSALLAPNALAPLCLALACCGGAQATPGGALGVPAVPTYALVPHGASLYAAPDEAAPHAARPQVSGAGADVVRIVDDRGGWIAVEPVRDVADHCVASMEGLQGLQLRLFVTRDELARTVTRETRMDYGDGTSVVLEPGVLLVPAPQFRRSRRPIFTVAANDLMFNTWLDETALGDRYRFTPRVPTPESDYVLARGTRPLFGGAARVGRSARVEEPDYVYARTDGAGGSLVALRRPCAMLEVRVAPSAIVPARESGAPAGAVAVPSMPWAHAGAQFLWPDGSPAGIARGEVHFDGEVAPHGELRCLLKRLGPWTGEPARADEGDVLTLCAPAAQIEGPSAVVTVPEAPPANPPSAAPASAEPPSTAPSDAPSSASPPAP